jgi:hypothetical protein
MDNQPVYPGMAEARWPKDGDNIPERIQKKQVEPKPPIGDRLKNVLQEYCIYDKLFKEELEIKVLQYSR